MCKTVLDFNVSVFHITVRHYLIWCITFLTDIQIYQSDFQLSHSPVIYICALGTQAIIAVNK